MKPGPQPARCVLEDCDNPPVVVGDYCQPHKDFFAGKNGTAAGPPIVEPDDPALLEREAARAAVLEEREYAERRRVKTWKTLENGSRVPETWWSEEELAAMEAEALAMVSEIPARRSELAAPRTFEDPPDPSDVDLKYLKRCVRGKYGGAVQTVARGMLAGMVATLEKLAR